MALGLLILQLAVQLWVIGKYYRASQNAKQVAARIERIEYGYDSSMGASVRVATLHFVLLEKPDSPQETISFSCHTRCAIDDLLKQLKISSLDQLVGQARPAYVFEDTEVHLHLLSIAEIWRLVGVVLLFKVFQVGGVGVAVHLLKSEDDPP